MDAAGLLSVATRIILYSSSAPILKRSLQSQSQSPSDEVHGLVLASQCGSLPRELSRVRKWHAEILIQKSRQDAGATRETTTSPAA